MAFTRQPCPVWLFTDLDGNILDDTYFAHFLTNEIPYIPQPVYQDADGTTPWNNPLNFDANGTLPNNLYFQTDLTYRIEIRQGNTQADPLIYLIQNFVPDGGVSPTPSLILPTDNQFSNSQFPTISFNESLEIVNTGTNDYDIAPGWVLNLVGSATMTVERQAITGDDPTPDSQPTNPSYVLVFTVSSGTFTTVKLRQRFSNTPAIWAEQGVSVNLTAKMGSGSNILTVVYTPSTGTAVSLMSLPVSSTYTELASGAVLPASDNSDSGDSAYVDIVFNLPVTGVFYITNIQIVGGVTDGAPIPFEQTTIEQQTSALFWYYKDALLHQPKSTIIAGWDFALNPWQFRTSASSNVANNAYTADQTIIIQQAYVAAATPNNVAVGRASHTANYAFQITPVTATNKVMVLQYIDASTVRPYWGKTLSARVRAYITTSHATVPTFKLRLMYKAAVPNTISQTDPVASWDNTDDSIPSVTAAGWTYISCQNEPTYTLTATEQAFDFNGFDLPASTDANMTLGIAFIMMDNLDATATADVLSINSISLLHNDFALDVPPMTFDESLKRCQFHYEKSFNVETLPLAVATAGAATSMIQTNALDRPIGMDRTFKATKRVTPTMVWYSTVTGAANTVRNLVSGTDFVVSSNIYQGKTSTGVPILNANATDNDYMAAQWSADARLGLI